MIRVRVRVNSSFGFMGRVRVWAQVWEWLSVMVSFELGLVFRFWLGYS